MALELEKKQCPLCTIMEKHPEHTWIPPESFALVLCKGFTPKRRLKR